MNQLTNTLWQQIKPDDADQGVVFDRAIPLETVLQQAGYSLGNDVHTFYSASELEHPCAFCARRRACADNRPVREADALRPLGYSLSTLSIRLN